MKLLSLALTLALLGLSSAFELRISDKADQRRACSGMWGGDKAYIKVHFDPASHGQVAMVIYEWRDTRCLGIDTEPDTYLAPISSTKQRTFICTTGAVHAKICPESQLGEFILNLKGASLEQTSIWSASVGFGNSTGNSTTNGNDIFALPPVPRRVNNTVVPSGVLWYKEPILYQVDKKGYYCVATIPIAIGATANMATHAEYKGHVLFHNAFHGKLAAADYPRVNLYMVIALVYLVLGAVWGLMCFKHQDHLLTLQFYISYLIGFLITEMTATWGYYSYLNSHDPGTAAIMFLVVVIINAVRYAASFFLLLVISSGLSVVTEPFGPDMNYTKSLTGACSILGVLFEIGTVVFDSASVSLWLFLMCVIPYALTLVIFLVAIKSALWDTMGELEKRKETYKHGMFHTLDWVMWLFAGVTAVTLFVLLRSFSNSLDEDYDFKTWETRWCMFNAWPAILYFLIFTSFAFLCRPTGDVRRLAATDEVAQGENTSEQYDMRSIHPGGLGGMGYARLPDSSDQA